VVGNLEVDGVPNGPVSPEGASEWRFSFSDRATGAPIRAFVLNHDRPMHLMIVREDLASFAHLHPSVDAAGRFSLRIGAPSDDPDNADAAHAIAGPGTYLVFAEVQPEGRSPVLARFSVTAPGPEHPQALVADEAGPSGAIEKYVAADGSPGKPGDPYRVSFTLDRSPMMGMAMLTLTATVEARDAQGRYAGVSDLEPWLGMAGHAVWVGAKGQGVEDRVFVHAHAMGGHEAIGHAHHGMVMSEKPIGPQLSFMLMGDEVPPAGLYKVWCQFKHRGRVLTVSVVLHV
jgi:hypothetical protein